MIQPEIDLIAKLKADTRLEYIEDAAYIMATIKHETAGTFRPIEEYGKGRGHSYGEPDPDTGVTYYGRGYVQLTWKTNYEKFGKILNKDLVNHPELALDPNIAYDIIIIGMLNGLFTGHRLSDYITDKDSDYTQARRIVNGTDKALVIAGYAQVYETEFE